MDTITWKDLLLLSPLGVIGAWRWGVWLWQKILLNLYRPYPVRRLSPLSVSVVVPVYNENPTVFARALESWMRNGPQEVIAVIDATDTVAIDVFRNFQAIYPAARLVITDEPGKRPALVRGALRATGDVVAFVDSDTIWDENIREKLLAPFVDPRIGGVAPRQAVLAPRTIAERLFSIRLDLRSLHEFPYLMAVGNVLTCLSGRTALYRRTALLPLLAPLQNERFLGRQCISGDDKRLTELLLKAGWRMYFQQNAVVRTPGTPSLFTFYRQSLRWGRNSWRTDLKVLFTGRLWWREPLFIYHLIDRMIQPFTLLLGPIYFAVSIALRAWPAAAVLVVWWLGSRAIKIYPHLKENPRDVLTIPIFVVSQYVIALLKIYALFTLYHQSWITRWDTNRLPGRSFFSLLPARAAALAAVGVFTFAIVDNEMTAADVLAQKRAADAKLAEERRALRTFPYTEDFSSFNLAAGEQTILTEMGKNATASYVTRLRDTPQTLARKFNWTLAETQSVVPFRFATAWLPTGRKLAVPVSLLRRPLDPATLPQTRPPIITYDAATNTVAVSERGSVVTLATIAKTIARPEVITNSAPGEWILRANLRVGEGATLVLDGGEVKWLKLASSPKGFVALRSYNGGILIRNTKITSWDESAGTYDTNYDDGRAYVVASANGRMDVLDSEIAYLGYPRAVEMKRGTMNGGIYGLSWKIPNGTFGRYILTGVVRGNDIHDNYFGMYMYGATGMLVENNEVHGNVQYGIDPHDDSNNLLIADNFVHNNGNHGIIGSKRVVYSIIRGNRSVDNRLHGIMLDRQSNFNIVEDNEVSGNVNGLAIYDSHDNLVRGNTFADNRFGIRANMNSSENRFAKNTLRGNDRAIYLYGGAKDNVAIDNTIVGNTQVLALKETTGNIFVSSIPPRGNLVGVYFDQSSRTTNYVQRIP